MQTRQSYLKAMGIEVWRYRAPGPLAVSEAPSAPGPRPSQNAAAGIDAAAAVLKRTASTPAVRQDKQAAPSRPSSAQQRDSREPVPEFRLGLLRYETLGIVVSLSPTGTVPRRLCDDIVRLLAGQHETPSYHLLEWPMLDSSSIDQSLSAARQVVTQKLTQLPSRVLVLGEGLGEYFGPLASLADGEAADIGRQNFMLVSNLEALKSSADQKRQLMHRLQRWQQT
jgi:hypothetical protein